MHQHVQHLQALESDTRVLAYEAGRKWHIRVNSISAGPLGSRAARAIGFIDDMIRCVEECITALGISQQGSMPWLSWFDQQSKHPVCAFIHQRASRAA
jgi:hypothetical protein